MKYNNEVWDAILDLKHPMFTYPDMPEEKMVIDKDGNQVYEKPNEVKVFKWKRLWDGINNFETEYKNIKKQCNHWFLDNARRPFEHILRDQRGRKN